MASKNELESQVVALQATIRELEQKLTELGTPGAAATPPVDDTSQALLRELQGVRDELEHERSRVATRNMRVAQLLEEQGRLQMQIHGMEIARTQVKSERPALTAKEIARQVLYREVDEDARFTPE